MQLFVGSAPHFLTAVSVLRADTVSLVLVPAGMLLAESVRQAIAVCLPWERDTIRMSFGVPPVGIDAATVDWGNPETRWCSCLVPERMRYVAEWGQPCACGAGLTPSLV